MANLIVDHKVGDTWNGFSFTLEDEDTMLPVDLTGVSVLIQFKITPNSITAFELGISVQAISENSINMIFEKFLNEKINIGGNK